MKRHGRIDGIDIARFLALAGMMVVHLGPDSGGAGAHPSVGDLIAGGRSATLFAFLAGLSIALVYRHDPRGSGSAHSIAVRAGLIFLLGLGLGSMNEVGISVILSYYGLLFLLAIPLRNMPVRTLLILSALWALVAPILSFALRRVVGFRESGQAELSDLAHPWSFFLELTLDGIYPVLTWVVYLMVGLAVGQMDLRSRLIAGRLAAAGAALLVVAYSLAGIAMWGGMIDGWTQSPRWATFFVQSHVVPTDSWTNLALLGTHTNTPLNVVGSVGSALLATGLCLLLMRSAGPLTRRASLPLRAAGSMTLTLYTAHALLNWAAHDHGYRITDGAYSEWIAQLLILTLFATIWRARFRRGPLEEVVHFLSVPRRVRASNTPSDSTNEADATTPEDKAPTAVV